MKQRKPEDHRRSANQLKNQPRRQRSGTGSSAPPQDAQHQSTKSVAAANSVRGIARPRALAALRLMTSSNLPGP